jgi:hypothetical protein
LRLGGGPATGVTLSLRPFPGASGGRQVVRGTRGMPPSRMQSMKPDAGPAVVTARYKAGCRGSFMRVDDHTEPKIYHRAALFAIGRQLQAEYSVHHPELMPDRLVSLFTKLDRDVGTFRSCTGAGAQRLPVLSSYQPPDVGLSCQAPSTWPWPLRNWACQRV